MMTIDLMSSALCALLATGLITWTPPRREDTAASTAERRCPTCKGSWESCNCGPGRPLPRPSRAAGGTR